LIGGLETIQPIYNNPKKLTMNPNFNGGCLSGPCPPDTTSEEQTIYKSLAYTILAFVVICLASYALHA